MGKSGFNEKGEWIFVDSKVTRELNLGIQVIGDCYLWKGDYGEDLRPKVIDKDGESHDVRNLVWEGEHERGMPKSFHAVSGCKLMGLKCISAEHAKLNVIPSGNPFGRRLSDEEMKEFLEDAHVRKMGIRRLMNKWKLSQITVRRYLGRR